MLYTFIRRQSGMPGTRKQLPPDFLLREEARGQSPPFAFHYDINKAKLLFYNLYVCMYTCITDSQNIAAWL